MNEKTCGEKSCIDCRWCELRLDLEAGSRYLCTATNRPLAAGDVIHRTACAAYEPLAVSAYWGP